MCQGCFDDTKGVVLVNNFAAKKPSALGLDTYYKQYYLCCCYSHYQMICCVFFILTLIQ
ncbi:hypothetical protein DsansV1_C25g0189801 [Dioscorea sansibarensis]